MPATVSPKSGVPRQTVNLCDTGTLSLGICAKPSMPGSRDAIRSNECGAQRSDPGE